MKFEDYESFYKNERALEKELLKLVESVKPPEITTSSDVFDALKQKIMLLSS